MNEIEEICQKFLDDIDGYLKNKDLKCKEIFEIYDHFTYHQLTKFRSNRSGFTGLSELIIFRFLYHLLGGSFDRDQYLKTKTFSFKSKLHENLWIAQGVSIPIPGDGNRKPDVVIYKCDKLIGVVQIKVNPTYGVKTIENEVAGLKELKKHNSEMRALLVILYKVSEKTLEALKKKKADTPWFDFSILCKEENEDKSFAEVLQKSLSLESLGFGAGKTNCDSYQSKVF